MSGSISTELFVGAIIDNAGLSEGVGTGAGIGVFVGAGVIVGSGNGLGLLTPVGLGLALAVLHPPKIVVNRIGRTNRNLRSINTFL